MAFASIHVPDFLVQAALRIDTPTHSRAVAIIDGVSPAETVVAASEAAMRAGIRPGMTPSQAAQFRNVELRHRSRAQEQAAHAVLLDLGWSVSPRVEDTAVDTIVLDLSGLASLFGPEDKIAQHLTQHASGFGLSVHVAVAAHIEVAFYAARGFPGVTVIPAGEESCCLGPLPVAVLSPPSEILETLDRWGVRTCAALASLPVLDLSERLGQVGVRLHQSACGAAVRSLVLAEPSLRFEESMPLESAVAELEPLAFLLGRLLGQLCARLAARSLAAMAIRLTFDLEASAENEEVQVRSRRTGRKPSLRRHESVLRLPVPMHDSKMLLQLLRLQLQANPPAAPILKIVLAADPAPPRVAQGGLFLPPSPDPEKLELTMARLAHLVGNSNVGSPHLVDTHRPGAFRMDRFQPASSVERCGPHRSKPGTGFRVFRPPVPAVVQLSDSRPVRISIRGRRGAVVVASGPWRTSGEWWGFAQPSQEPSQEESTWQQDEWDLEVHFDVHSGARFDDSSSLEAPPRGLYRVYYDAIRHGWFVRGMYD